MTSDNDDWTRIRSATRELLAEDPETFVSDSPASGVIQSERKHLRDAGYSEDEIADVVGKEMLDRVAAKGHEQTGGDHADSSDTE